MATTIVLLSLFLEQAERRNRFWGCWLGSCLSDSWEVGSYRSSLGLSGCHIGWKEVWSLSNSIKNTLVFIGLNTGGFGAPIGWYKNGRTIKTKPKLPVLLVKLRYNSDHTWREGRGWRGKLALVEPWLPLGLWLCTERGLLLSGLGLFLHFILGFGQHIVIRLFAEQMTVVQVLRKICTWNRQEKKYIFAWNRILP